MRFLNKLIDRVGKETVILLVSGFLFLLFAWLTVWFPNIKENIPPVAFTWISYIGIGLSIYVCYSYWGKMCADIRDDKIGDNFYPTLMVAQGTFYTFVGISVILITFGDNSTIKELLAGLRLAFITSVIGLIFSVAAKMYIKKEITEHSIPTNSQYPVFVDDEQMFHTLLDIRNAIQDQTDVVKQQNENFLNSQNSYLQKSQLELSTQTTNLIEGINASIEKNNEKYTKAIEDTNKEYINAINNISVQVKEHIKTYSNSLANLHVQFEQIGKQLIDEIQKNNRLHSDSIIGIKMNIREYVEETIVQFRTIHQEAIESLNSTKFAIKNVETCIGTLNDSYKYNAEVFGQFSQSVDSKKIKELSDAIAVFAEEMNKIVKEMNCSANALVQIMPEIKNILDVAHNMNDQAKFINSQKEDLNTTMNNMATRFGTTTNKMLGGFNKASEQVVKKWEKIGDTYWENFEQQFNIVYKAMNEQVIDIFKTAGEKFKEAVKDTDRSIKELNENSEETKFMLKAINDNTTDIKELIQAIDKLRQSVDALRQISVSIGQFSNEENK